MTARQHRLFALLIGLAAIASLVLAECQRIAADVPHAPSVTPTPAHVRESCPDWDKVG